MGQYGLDVRIEREDRLIEFCRREPNNQKHILRSTPKTRFQNNITRVAAYTGADIASNHNLIIGDFKYKGKIMKERRNIKGYNIKTSKEPDKRDNLIEALEGSFKAKIPSGDQTERGC
ncbi:hypothetical protein WA026_012404 [Henosepilachna vigintioctopunctata]|uniref:Uncharacterized protein n=1 Tax=Henosepilachna vigintioctopunctata TaxID=420089 RepID=A0AAW1UT12_9CUCU